MSKRGKIIVLVVANFVLLLLSFVGVWLYVENKKVRLYEEALSNFNSCFQNGDVRVKSFTTPYGFDYTDITDEECPKGIKTYEVDVVSVDRKGESCYGWGLEVVKKSDKFYDKDSVMRQGAVVRFILFPTYINVRDTNSSPTGYIESDFKKFLRNYKGYNDGNSIANLKSIIDNEYYHLAESDMCDNRDYERRVAEEFEQGSDYYRVFGSKTLFSTYSVQLRHEDVIMDDFLNKLVMVLLMLLVVEMFVTQKIGTINSKIGIKQ